MTDSRNGIRIQCRSRTVLFAAGMAMAFFLAAAPCRAGQNLIFIVDASASMADPLSTETKIAATREALIDAFKTLPDGVDAGLMVFGGRRQGDCDDVRMALPVGRHGVQAFAAKVNGIVPTGMTPLAASLASLNAQAKGFRDPTTAIVVADGQETCLGDPCEEARLLKRVYRDMVVYVIGLNVPLYEETSLVCISGNTGGRYHKVSDKAALKTALAEAIRGDKAIPSPAGDFAAAVPLPDPFGPETPETLPPVVEPDAPEPSEPAAAPPPPPLKRKVPAKRFENPPAEPVRKVRVEVRRGRVREGPSLSSRVLFHVEKGTALSVLGVRGDWNHVMDDRGRSGWAHYSLFSPHFRPNVKKLKAVPRVLDIDVSAADGETRVRFGLSRPLRPKVTFRSKKGPVVVCDFPDAGPGSDILKTLPKTPVGCIRTMTTEVNPSSGFRVRIDLAPGQPYRLQHILLEKAPAYLMVIRPEMEPTGVESARQTDGNKEGEQ